MMPESKIFYSDIRQQLENKIKDLLNKQENILSTRTIDSPRAVAAAIEHIIAEKLETILDDLVKEYSPQSARRAMADFKFTDQDNLNYLVDVKTHRLDTNFNMPNITSVERLSRLYEDDSNYFCVLKIDYKIEGSKVEVYKVIFVPIEFISWDCLTLGALGWGQIQIANANIVTITPKSKRKGWMTVMCDKILDFYPKEILKINDRIDRFREVKKILVE